LREQGWGQEKQNGEGKPKEGLHGDPHRSGWDYSSVSTAEIYRFYSRLAAIDLND
jgi:hypothetical protein